MIFHSRIASISMAFTLVAILMLPLSGCGGSNLDRVPVSGTVTLNGEPLPSGSVRFIPTGEGQSAGGNIENGKFEIPKSAGPAPGKYRVEIVSYQPTGRQIPDPDSPGATKEELEQVVPTTYNRDSTLEKTIESGGDNNFDFPLTSP